MVENKPVCCSLLTCVAASATVDVHETTAAWYDDMIDSLKLIPSQPVASGRVAVELAKCLFLFFLVCCNVQKTYSNLQLFV